MCCGLRPDHTLGLTDQEVDAAGRLHDRGGHDHGQDYQHHIHGRAGGRQAEDVGEHQDADASPQAQAHAAGPAPEEDRRDDHRELQE